jgi:hypothetical protein
VSSEAICITRTSEASIWTVSFCSVLVRIGSSE